MKNVFLIAQQDTMLASLLNLKNPNTLLEFSKLTRFSMPKAHELPYVSEYLVDFDETVEALRRFIGSEIYKGFMRLDYMVALPDDCTDIESRAIDQIMICCGGKGCITEYQAFLLSNEPEYLAVTASKRSVIVTHVSEDDETEQVFIDISDATQEHVEEACRMLDEVRELPVFTFQLPDSISIGSPVSEETILRNFVRLQ